MALFCKECRAMSLEIPYLVDVNAGTDRTGVRIAVSYTHLFLYVGARDGRDDIL